MLEAQPSPEEEADWDREYHQRLFDWAVQQVCHEFEQSTWKAFWQTAVEAVPPKTVAGRLGMSVGAVYIAKSRVLSRLKERIREATDQ